MNYLIVANSTEIMLKINKGLKDNNIKTNMVPAPPESGTVCAIALEVNEIDLPKSEEILKSLKITAFSVYLEKKLKLQGLIDKKLNNISSQFIKIIGTISEGEDISFEDIVYLLKTQNKKEIDIIFNTADKIRQEMVGDVVEIRGAIEFSNYCSKNCSYCGIGSSIDSVKRYRMTEDEILEVVHSIHKMGLKTVILQSGEDPYYTIEMIINIMKRIKVETNMRITLSIGVKTKDEYEILKKNGADNFLLKIESTNKQLFESVHPDDDYETRRKCSEYLKELGYINGSGNIIGLPNQTIEDLANDILYFKEMGINMIGLGPFIPAKGSKLETHNQGDIELTLRVVAITRILCKKVYIPSTTALASLSEDAQVRALQSGANSIMLISTPIKYRNLYNIYDNKNMVDLENAILAIKKSGRKLPKYLLID